MYLGESRRSVSEMISFWKSKRRIPMQFQLRNSPFITKLDGKTQISFRKYQEYLLDHPNTISFRQYQLVKPLVNNEDVLNKASNSPIYTDLKEDWQEVTSPEGFVYYWNTVTNKTQYEKPKCGFLAPTYKDWENGI